MAFISMLIGFFVILIGLLVVFFIVGGILLLIGLINEKQVKLQGKRFPHVLISIGAVLMIIPMSLVGSVVAYSTISKIQLDIQRRGYDNFTDEWANEYVSHEEAGDDVIAWILAAADEGNKDEIMEVYTADIQKDAELSEQVDAFLEIYPGGLSDLEYKYVYGYGTGDREGDNYISRLYHSYEILKDGEYYYIDICACYESELDSERLGVESFSFKSERAKVCNQDVLVDTTDKEYILAVLDVDGDFATRRIDGYPVKFTAYNRNITLDDVAYAAEYVTNLDVLYRMLGTPNAIDLQKEFVYYEIEPLDGKLRYAMFKFDSSSQVDGFALIRGTEADEISEYIYGL